MHCWRRCLGPGAFTRRPRLLALLVALPLAVVAVWTGVPASAGPLVVGYLPPGVDYGISDDSPVELGEVHAQGVVVDNLEPDGCPPEGCGYELIVVDPAGLRDEPGTADEAHGCGGPAYGIVDGEPGETALGSGARVYTGSGPIPRQTADTADTAPGDSAPGPLTPGVGLLCFAAHSDQAPGDGPGRGRLAATQPAPVVILYDPEASPAD